MTYKILIVDDEPSNLRALERLLSRSYSVVTTGSGAEALQLILQHDFAAIISDQRMPGMNGVEFLVKAAEMRQQTVRILLTGYTDVDTLVEAINSGVVYQYVSKPWKNDDLVQTVRRALEHHESVKQTYRSKLDLTRLHSRCEALRSGAARLFDELVGTRFPQLLAHSARIGDQARVVAAALRLDGDRVRMIARAARIFPAFYGPQTVADVLGTANLSAAERGERASEFLLSMEMFGELTADEEYREIADMLRFANEYFDGSGFPEQLAGDRIPIASRILAAVRAYDLLTAVGQHGRTLTHDQAIARLSSGTHDRFDPGIIEAMSGPDFAAHLAAAHVPPANAGTNSLYPNFD